MRRRRRQRQHGVTMVEFSLVLPFLLVIIFGMIDFGRAVNVNTTVAEAARQGARQSAASAAAGDNPFTGPVNGTCSGQVFTTNVSATQGCLTDSAILATVKAVLNNVTSTVASTNASAANCPSPSAGTAEVCIYPAESGTPSTYTSCANAKSALGHDPAPGDLGTRKEEWTSPKFASDKCFLVEVTVKFAFKPWTPIVTNIIGSNIQIVASTSTTAEY